MQEGRLLFTSGDAGYYVSHVIAAARHWGDWRALERSTVERTACLKRAAREGDPLAPAAAEREVEKWRRARRLISAEETRAWLRERDVDFSDVQRHVRGAVLADTWSDELDATVARHAVADEEIAERLYPEGVCSGVLAEVARRLAGRVAVQPAREGGGEANGAAEQGWLARLDENFECFRKRLLSEAEVEREIASHQMDWLALRCEVVAFARPHPAREAALSVRTDGADLVDVSRRAGAGVKERRLYLEEAEPMLRQRLLSAREGELIGPLESDGAHLVVHVLEKTSPSYRDRGVRRRAEKLIEERALAREVASVVSWHAGL